MTVKSLTRPNNWTFEALKWSLTILSGVLTAGFIVYLESIK